MVARDTDVAQTVARRLAAMNDNRRVRTWGLVALGATAIVPVMVACGGSNNQPPNTAGSATASFGVGQPPYGGYAQGGQPPYGGYPQGGGYPSAQGGYGQPPYGQQGAQTGPVASGSAAPGPLAPTDPNSLQGILQGIQNALQGTVTPNGGGGDLTATGLQGYALKVAPGMQPDQGLLEQNLTEGQHAVMMVTLQAGKCYTLVGYSAPGAVRDVDLNMLAPPLYMTLAGQDLSHNNMPVIGSAPSPMCPVIAFPLQYKIDVFARQGSGTVAVQLYSKNK